MSASLGQWLQGVRRQEAPPGRPAPLPAHVGAWLDRCLIEPPPQPGKADERPGRRLLQEVAVDALRMSPRGPDTPAIAHYRHVFDRWERTARAASPGVVRRVLRARTTARLLLHPATQETVTEGGLLLHHTYGVPYLPGSALKGAARAWATRPGVTFDRRTEADDKLLWSDHLFGLERAKDEPSNERRDTAGFIDFWDALLVPEPPPEAQGPWSPLALDVVNPHHGKYYTQHVGRPVPSDTDEPVPTHLLTVAPRAMFLLVAETQESPGRVLEAWLDWVIDTLLRPALRELGLGARTSSGYGRVELLERAGSTTVEKRTAAPSVEPPASPGWVSWQKGQSLLRATFDGSGGTAEVRGPAVAELLAALSEGTRARLAKGKSLRLLVRWTPDGNAKRITKLSEG